MQISIMQQKKKSKISKDQSNEIDFANNTLVKKWFYFSVFFILLLSIDQRILQKSITISTKY